MQDDWGNCTHRLGFCVNEEDHIWGWVGVDGFGVIDELVNFGDYWGGLELEIEDKVNCVEDFLVGIQTFGWGEVFKLILNSGFENLLN